MCAEWRGADCCQAAGWPSPLSIRSETRNTRIREYEPPAFPLGASLFPSVGRALGEVLQSGEVWTAVRRQAGHPHSLLGLKHVAQTKSPQSVGGGAAEWRDVDCCQAAGWPSPLYTWSETRSTN